MPRKGNYSRDEWVALLYYRSTQPEPTQTDSHPQLVQFASHIGRTPSSVDANMRTIKRVQTGAAGFEHGARLMKEVVEQYGADLAGVIAEAPQALTRINPDADFTYLAANEPEGPDDVSFARNALESQGINVTEDTEATLRDVVIEEGGTIFRTVRQRHRSQTLRAAAIVHFRAQNDGRIFCSVCGFDFG